MHAPCRPPNWPHTSGERYPGLVTWPAYKCFWETSRSALVSFAPADGSAVPGPQLPGFRANEPAHPSVSLVPAAPTPRTPSHLCSHWQVPRPPACLKPGQTQAQKGGDKPSHSGSLATSKLFPV